MLTYCTSEGRQDTFYKGAQRPSREKAKMKESGAGGYPETLGTSHGVP